MAISTDVAPIPYKTPIIDSSRLITVPWQNWFRQLFNRVGGNVASPLLNPMTGIGDLIYGGSSGSPTRLAADATNSRKFLREQSVGGITAPPVWDTLTTDDIPTLNYISSVATQLANLVLAGPASGGAAAPTFRALVAADIPAMNGTVTPLSLSASLTLTSGYCTTWPDLTIPSGKTVTVVSGSVFQGIGYLTVASGGTLTVNSGGVVHID